ncbi:MAG: DUF3524 domain-containing protein [Pseudomonadales bacterium]
MNILLLSAYDARSHQLWRAGLNENFAEFNWTTLALPARHYAWRARSNAMQWYLQNHEVLDKPYDLLIATSMVDLASLRGLIPRLAGTPTVLYFHENQFAYPQGNSGHSTIELQLCSIYGALAADEIVFNSEYNQRTFIEGARGLLAAMPDKLNEPAVQQLKTKSSVLPVPIGLRPHTRDEKANTARPVSIVWNHRWEFDKGPERLYAFCKVLLACELDFVLHVVGQQFRKQPAAFNELHALLEDARPSAIGRWGFVSDASEYYDLLRSCDVVLSTALHDFQGLAVLEAVSSGCVPLVPDRLAYPEWFSAQFRYACSADDGTAALEKEAGNAVETLRGLIGNGLNSPSIDQLGWNKLRRQYQKLIQRVGRQC